MEDDALLATDQPSARPHHHLAVPAAAADEREVDLAQRFTLTGEAALLFGLRTARERPKFDKDEAKAWQTNIFYVARAVDLLPAVGEVARREGRTG